MNSLAPSSRAPAPGIIIAGRFRLLRMLGQGGMGSVWAAHHMGLDAEVALKFIDPDIADRVEILSRFAQEAVAAAKIKSPHVVGIFDHGIDEVGRAFIAMELLKGEDLAARLERSGNLSPAETSEIIKQAAKGLAKAHAAGIVHRDLKPENLFLVDDDEGGFIVKILDFGIAKAHGASGGASAHKTATGQIIGTPMYMSPEQALGRSLDPRSDLYSLAVVAFRCLTGRPPFIYDAVGELIVAVSTLPPPKASEFRPELPSTLDVWFDRALQKDPAKRFGSARVLAETFAGACDGQAPSSEMIRSIDARGSDPSLASARTIDVKSGVARATTLDPPGSKSAPQSLPSLPPPRRSGVVLGVAAVATFAIAGAAAFVFLRPTPAEVRPPVAVVPSASEVKPSEPATIEVRVAASPASASIFWDGQPLGQNPFSGNRPRDRRDHKIRAEAAGYQAAERMVSTDANVELVLTLDPIPSVPAGTGAAPTSPTGAGRTSQRNVAPSSSSVAGASSAAPVVSARPAPSGKTGVTLDKDDPWKTH